MVVSEIVPKYNEAMHPTLYVMLGHPGSGKTTAARLISQLAGAEHIWTDHERVELFGVPTHTERESQELYKRLNARTKELLSAGKSVVFDTSFNYVKDRNYMRSIAASNHANFVVVWLQAPQELAKTRALSSEHARSNRYPHTMDSDMFRDLAGRLEEPRPNEHAVILDGTKISADHVAERLNLKI